MIMDSTKPPLVDRDATFPKETGFAWVDDRATTAALA
jgi:hypothetical protein